MCVSLHAGGGSCCPRSRRRLRQTSANEGSFYRSRRLQIPFSLLLPLVAIVSTHTRLGPLSRPTVSPLPHESVTRNSCQRNMSSGDKKAVVKNADMSEEMQDDAINTAIQALDKYNIEKDIAAFIKKEFDKKYNPTWHCIVGRNFGSYVTHETKHFIYFYLGQVAILLFKSG